MVWAGAACRHTLSSGDIREGRLVRLNIEDVPPGGLALPMFGVYPIASPPGPAGRWLIERLKNLCPAKLAGQPA
ncbi:Uncharacterised protein [Cedecea neteri]|uniref:LysR substrate binding domain n=1 Tax=Cedecea neteri TaxID=158822 RepID=A0A2X3KUS8_9ENTR|nr:Uncharacterised protein [Cedecea neteri]